MRTRDLVRLHNTGHPGINALFAKAHSADWDIENDVDWSVAVGADDPLVAPEWAAYGGTPTFRSLPQSVQTYATRRSLGRMLNILQVGESVAQNVCAKLVLVLREEDYRNHAAAQAMDEARHHLAYRRFLDRMGEEPEDIDGGTEMMFDALLAEDDPLELIATEQFFLEGFAMSIFEGLRDHATHPLLRRVIELITRDESRHMGFGVLYVAEWLRRQPQPKRIGFARHWLAQILGSLLDKPGPIFLSRVVRRLKEAGVRDAETLGPAMLREQRELNARELADAASGVKVPHLLKSARRAGLLAPDIVEALGLANQPLIRGALQGAGE
ncbi:MAG TPA: ferritin-like domain-containing protein [Candidatus Eisenbacteria bacterium]|nr:ferritin-like domain-containing protein [Candidatus Eisenbacteria bacterium]